MLAQLMSVGLVQAAPAHWQLWTDGQGGKLYFDLDSLKREGKLLTVREKEELASPDTRGIKSSLYQRQYDFVKKQWRTVGKQVYNAKGKLLLGNKKREKWQKIAKDSGVAAQVEFLYAASRLQGQWIQVKKISNIAVKYYDGSSLTQTGDNTLEVWEKLEMNKPKEKVKTVITFVRYDLAKNEATTFYTCNFNARGELVNAHSEVDHWSAAEDSYGEYIGRELNVAINSHLRVR